MTSSLLPYAVLLAFSTLVSALLATVGVRFRGEIGTDWFVATMGLATVWNAVGFAQLFASGYVLLALCEVVTTVMSVAVPVVWFTFVVEYAGRGNLINRRTLVALWSIPVVGFVSMATYPVGNQLYFTSIDVVAAGDQFLVQSPPGPVAILTLWYVYVLFVIGFWQILRIIYEHENLYTGQALTLLVGTLLGAGVVLVKFFAIPDYVPVASVSVAPLGAVYSYGLYRHRLLDLTPATRRIGSSEALNDLGEGVVIVDGDWDVVAINESACRQFDRQRSTVLGSGVGAVHPALRIDESTDRIVSIRLDNRTYEVTTSTVEDSRERLAGYALVIRDVTVKRSRKQRLEVLNRALRHNLRNDVSVVKGYANEIAARGDEETVEMAASIDASADDLLTLAEKAREVERTLAIDGRDERPVDVERTVETVVDELNESSPETRVDVDVPTELAVTTDAPTLELVIRNVVENAVRHGTPDPDGGCVESQEGANADVVVRARRTDDGVEISVSDDGPGVPASELAVIRRGTETALEHCSGLGLWLVDWGAVRIDADLAYDTTDGTTVTLSVPEGDASSETGDR